MQIVDKKQDVFRSTTTTGLAVATDDHGPVSARDIALVQSTWKQVQPIAEHAAALFYNKLFALDPSLQSLFTSDIAEQGAKLMQTITLAVTGLDNLDTLVPVVQGLGERHVGYGVEAHHYDTVAAALLWTLEQGLGEGFTDEVKLAWINVYTLLADTMKRAAAQL